MCCIFEAFNIFENIEEVSSYLFCILFENPRIRQTRWLFYRVYCQMSLTILCLTLLCLTLLCFCLYDRTWFGAKYIFGHPGYSTYFFMNHVVRSRYFPISLNATWQPWTWLYLLLILIWTSCQDTLEIVNFEIMYTFISLMFNFHDLITQLTIYLPW